MLPSSACLPRSSPRCAEASRRSDALEAGILASHPHQARFSSSIQQPRDPFIIMKVEATDEKGEKQMWVIEGAAPQQLTEGGLTASTLRAGDRVIVTGYPGRIAEDHRLLLQVLERPSDGFKYQGPAANF